MAPTQSKMAKVETGKLWTHEERMINEKFFYLNKSTTKYIIVGLEIKTLEPVVKICDRVTGCYITIFKENFAEFTRIVASILAGTYRLERGFIDESILLCGISVYSISTDIWKFSQSMDYASVLIHKSSLKAFMRVAAYIQTRIMAADTAGYLLYIKELREDTVGLDLNDESILEDLYGRIEGYGDHTIEHQLLLDLISNRDLFVDLKIHQTQ